MSNGAFRYVGELKYVWPSGSGIELTGPVLDRLSSHNWRLVLSARSRNSVMMLYCRISRHRDSGLKGKRTADEEGSFLTIET